MRQNPICEQGPYEPIDIDAIVRSAGQPDRLVGDAVSLRDRPGAGGAYDRELRTGLIWNITRRSPYISAGLRSAGFQGGWL